MNAWSTLSGPQASDYLGPATTQLASGIPEGMRKLADAMLAGR